MLSWVRSVSSHRPRERDADSPGGGRRSARLNGAKAPCGLSGFRFARGFGEGNRASRRGLRVRRGPPAGRGARLTERARRPGEVPGLRGCARPGRARRRGCADATAPAEEGFRACPAGGNRVVKAGVAPAAEGGVAPRAFHSLAGLMLRPHENLQVGHRFQQTETRFARRFASKSLREGFVRGGKTLGVSLCLPSPCGAGAGRDALAA